MTIEPEWVIWSFEHHAWWRPGGFGYTPHLHQAGHYSQAEAMAIVERANIVRVNEEMLTVDAAVTDEVQHGPRAGRIIVPEER